MEVKCMMCGRKENINEEHKDYHKFEKNPKAIYICNLCQAKMLKEAKDSHDGNFKPM